MVLYPQRYDARIKVLSNIIRTIPKMLLNIEFTVLEISLKYFKMLYPINPKSPIVLAQMAPSD